MDQSYLTFLQNYTLNVDFNLMSSQNPFIPGTNLP